MSCCVVFVLGRLPSSSHVPVLELVGSVPATPLPRGRLGRARGQQGWLGIGCDPLVTWRSSAACLEPGSWLAVVQVRRKATQAAHSFDAHSLMRSAAEPHPALGPLPPQASATSNAATKPVVAWASHFNYTGSEWGAGLWHAGALLVVRDGTTAK